MRTRDEQIEKLVDVMRDYRLLHTKEEDNEPIGYPLIDALTYDGGTVDIGVEECGELAAELYDSVIASFILEAERRAEQRVRAEIGRDAERWRTHIMLLRRSHRHTEQEIQSTIHVIDAAREVG